MIAPPIMVGRLVVLVCFNKKGFGRGDMIVFYRVGKAQNFALFLLN